VGQLGVRRGVLDPRAAVLGAALQLDGGRDDDVLALGPALQDAARAEPLLHRRLAQPLVQVVFAQLLQAVPLARRVHKARHVHRVAAKARDGDAVVVEHVPVKRVVVPHLVQLVVLKVVSEQLQHLLAAALRVEAVHKQSRAVAKVQLVAAVRREADDAAPADGALRRRVDAGGLRIPRHKRILGPRQLVDNVRRRPRVPHDGHAVLRRRRREAPAPR
jgi:hypothetical protein